jgi:hypothetical protein
MIHAYRRARRFPAIRGHPLTRYGIDGQATSEGYRGQHGDRNTLPFTMPLAISLSSVTAMPPMWRNKLFDNMATAIGAFERKLLTSNWGGTNLAN